MGFPSSESLASKGAPIFRWTMSLIFTIKNDYLQRIVPVGAVLLTPCYWTDPVVEDICVTIFKIYIYMICILIFIFHQVFIIFFYVMHLPTTKLVSFPQKGILCCSSCFGPPYFPRIPNPILDNQTWAAKVARRPKWRLQQGRTLTLKQRSRHRQKPHLARRRPAKSLYQGSMKSPCRHFHRWMMQRRQELAPFAVPKRRFGWRSSRPKIANDFATHIFALRMLRSPFCNASIAGQQQRWLFCFPM